MIQNLMDNHKKQTLHVPQIEGTIGVEASAVVQVVWLAVDKNSSTKFPISQAEAGHLFEVEKSGN